MAAVNKVILVGNMGRDPEIRETPTGQKVANFSIATTERYNDQQGNRQEKTEWHNLVAWNRQAEVIQQYARKGTSMYIEGSLSTRSWDDQTSGQKRYRTEIVVRNFQFLGGGQGGGQSGGASSQGSQSGYSAPASGGQSGYTAPATEDFGSGSSPEDDLPF